MGSRTMPCWRPDTTEPLLSIVEALVSVELAHETASRLRLEPIRSCEEVRVYRCARARGITVRSAPGGWR